MNTRNVAALLKSTESIRKMIGKPSAPQLQEVRRYLSSRQLDEQKCALLNKKKKPE